MPAKRIVLAEYYCTSDATLAFGVRADWDTPRVAEIKRPLGDIRRYVAEHFGAPEAAPGGERPSTYSRVQQLDLAEWQAEFAPFVEPILKWAEPGDTLYLVPHDVLHYLPLHALQVEGGALSERNPVLYTPSASVLKYCQAKRKGRREQALVLGDSASEPGLALPNAREEAVQVAGLFGTQAFVGPAARKSLVKEKLDQGRDAIDVLHFACHGYFHPTQPLKSGILMSPEAAGAFGPAPDGDQAPAEFELALAGLPLNRFLTAEEIFGLELRADLVTLSACDSGINQVRPGDELFGLMRALIYAGTPSVLMSLWSVDDVSTELFMLHFYQRLKDEGSNKVEALQQAQKYLKELTAAQVLAYYDGLLAGLGATGNEARRAAISQARRSVSRKLMAAEAGAGHPVGQDYTIFSHPVFWAPFILVGDWK